MQFASEQDLSEEIVYLLKTLAILQTEAIFQHICSKPVRSDTSSTKGHAHHLDLFQKTPNKTTDHPNSLLFKHNRSLLDNWSDVDSLGLLSVYCEACCITHAITSHGQVVFEHGKKCLNKWNNLGNVLSLLTHAWRMNNGKITSKHGRHIRRSDPLRRISGERFWNDCSEEHTC